MHIHIHFTVRADRVHIVCPEAGYDETVSNCLIVDDAHDAIVDVGHTWAELGRDTQAQAPTCRAVIPFAVPPPDLNRLTLFVFSYVGTLRHTWRERHWWDQFIVDWRDHWQLTLEWPDYARLSTVEQRTLTTDLLFFPRHVLIINGRHVGRRTLTRVGGLALLVALGVLFIVLTQR